jgi:chromosome segregation ATPase
VSLRAKVESSEHEGVSLRAKVESLEQEGVSLRAKVESSEQEGVSLRAKVESLEQTLSLVLSELKLQKEIIQNAYASPNNYVVV